MQFTQLYTDLLGTCITFLQANHQAAVHVFTGSTVKITDSRAENDRAFLIFSKSPNIVSSRESCIKLSVTVSSFAV